MFIQLPSGLIVNTETIEVITERLKPLRPNEAAYMMTSISGTIYSIEETDFNALTNHLEPLFCQPRQKPWFHNVEE